jgi:predicted component of type VI protein secretion system
MTSRATVGLKRKEAADTDCLRDARAFAEGFPETTETALFAYQPDALSESVRARLSDLFEHNAGFQRIVQDMRKDRKWLAPQYGLK